MTRTRLLYRPCVGIAVFNAAGLVLIGHRRGSAREGERFAWQMPQGGIDRHETPVAAARRELYEETNIRSVSLLGEAPDWLNYDLPETINGSPWRGRYTGQTQKWFAMRFEGDESEIDVLNPAGGAHKPEFIDWRWERLERVPELIVPFKRQVYERIAVDFSRFAAP